MSTTDSSPQHRGEAEHFGPGVGGWEVGAGAAVCEESLNSLKPDGRLIITGVTSWPQDPVQTLHLAGCPMALLGGGARSRRSFAAMMHMVRRGDPRGVVDPTFELAQAGKTHEVIVG
jgi:NADPH:quinone reductase-like Zn-dependent oxidoreductase